MRPLAAMAGVIALLSDAAAFASDSLVLAAAGNLPIVLTAPHGGTQPVPGVGVRVRGNTLADTGTLELTQAVAERVAAALRGRPYVVAALFHRRYIDANRTEAEAIESARARSHYLAYHGGVRAFVSDARLKFPGGALLLDIHGQAQDPDTIHRGTRNGATLAALLHRHGPEAVTGPSSVLGYLFGRGYRVFPSGLHIGSPAEDPRYVGGYTVQAYGSHTPQGVDALQIEIGRSIRESPALADDLAAAIAVFARRYLLAPAR